MFNISQIHKLFHSLSIPFYVLIYGVVLKVCYFPSFFCMGVMCVWIVYLLLLVLFLVYLLCWGCAIFIFFGVDCLLVITDWQFLSFLILSCKSFFFLFLLLLCLFSSIELLYVVTVLPILKRGYNFSLLDCYPSKQDHWHVKQTWN